jgi:hypothetical protein
VPATPVPRDDARHASSLGRRAPQPGPEDAAAGEPLPLRRPRDLRRRGGFTRWVLDDRFERAGERTGPHGRPDGTHAWIRVMCVTGVDYFSTLAYQPAIAFLAAGFVSPLATLVLVALTLFGALPVYRHVAAESVHGEGSIAMLEHLLPWWGGKLFVLALLGFATTDFMLTITLSAASAAAHVVQSPLAPGPLRDGQLWVTLLLVLALGAVFLRGFRVAIRVAVVLVAVYLALNAVVVLTGLVQVALHPAVLAGWTEALVRQQGSLWGAVAFALLVFPRLALGLSGFETGVTVVPQIHGDPGDTEEHPTGRIRGAKRLLTTAAVTMSVFLLGTSFITTLLIPAQAFRTGGAANGRALAYLAHEYLGPMVGTLYDLSTIAILWIAGASALTGLLNIVPRYLPRYGLAPTWARAVRPLVLVFTGIAVLLTLGFDASVDAQVGAYATGVLVLITSATVAAALSTAHRHRKRLTAFFGVVAVVFGYTTVANIVERPDGVRIAAVFIAGILVVSLASRARRSFQLRARTVVFDDAALQYLAEAQDFGQVHLVANDPGPRDRHEYEAKARQERHDAHIPGRAAIIFLEVTKTDSSEFEEDLQVTGTIRHGFRVLEVPSGNIPSTIAAVLLQVREVTGVVPHVYFEWTEGNPISNMFRFLIAGEGEVAPVTREVLREAEHDVRRRPMVHVS